MAQVYLDHPGDLHWFSGYGPREVLGPCPHAACPHNAQSVVAWGPDATRYELMDCDVDDGCAGNCRAWVNGRGVATTPWLQVNTANSHNRKD